MVDIIDEALDILHHTGPEYSGGSNHGPMAAEAPRYGASRGCPAVG